MTDSVNLAAARGDHDPASPSHACADERFVVEALMGIHGPGFRDAADTAMATAIEHGYDDDDPARVAETVRALAAEVDGPVIER